ncbi:MULTISPECIES: right-handed parallel beta-helix repeat-containing protein [unclassified Streptomyces]|uniref:right-handed parallel beta-helix repeat-containing protein n=1 Tax=unclassified Streptomyces TaxID=2593676 RepID=UPI002E18CC23|nr:MULTISPECIES: right-handed parallel beta-helix repeat-containing protein [unclassified Streptomyces]
MATPVEWRPGMDITAPRLESMNQRNQFMVTNYGADASGGTDASGGIQEALNAARDLGGAQVLVPPGVYLIGQTLRIYGNTRLTLMQGAEFRRNVAGTMLINGDSGQAFGGYTGHSRIVIEGGLWNMRGTTSGLTGAAMCISIGHATDIVIRDLEVLDVSGYHAIELNSTSHGLVENCRFRGYVDNTADHSRGFSEAVQIDLAKGSGEFGGFGPYDHTPCIDILVQGCHFGNSDTAGTTAWPRGVGSHSATISKWHRRIRIANNSFEGLLQFAVSAYNWEDTTVTGNTFVSCGSGVRLRTVIEADPNDTKNPDGVQTNASQQMRNLAVTGNTFRGGTGYDNVIVALGEATGTVLNVAITGNTIDGSGGTEAAIRLQRVSRAVVSDNVVANSSGTGISTSYQNNTVISGNVVWGAGAYGITMDNSDNSNIIGNSIRDPQQSGIFLNGPGSDIQVRDNFVDGANQAGLTSSVPAAIRLSTTALTAVAITANKCRPGGASKPARNGLYIAAGHTGVQRFGNDMRGTWATANGIDDSSGASTVATDLQ